MTGPEFEVPQEILDAAAEAGMGVAEQCALLAPPCVHSWRLIEECRAPNARAIITKRRWYCARCRTVEETAA